MVRAHRPGEVHLAAGGAPAGTERLGRRPARVTLDKSGGRDGGVQVHRVRAGVRSHRVGRLGVGATSVRGDPRVGQHAGVRGPAGCLGVARARHRSIGRLRAARGVVCWAETGVRTARGVGPGRGPEIARDGHRVAPWCDHGVSDTATGGVGAGALDEREAECEFESPGSRHGQTLRMR